VYARGCFRDVVGWMDGPPSSVPTERLDIQAAKGTHRTARAAFGVGKNRAGTARDSDKFSARTGFQNKRVEPTGRVPAAQALPAPGGDAGVWRSRK